MSVTELNKEEADAVIGWNLYQVKIDVDTLIRDWMKGNTSGWKREAMKTIRSHLDRIEELME